MRPIAKFVKRQVRSTKSSHILKTTIRLYHNAVLMSPSVWPSLLKWSPVASYVSYMFWQSFIEGPFIFSKVYQFAFFFDALNHVLYIPWIAVYWSVNAPCKLFCFNVLALFYERKKQCIISHSSKLARVELFFFCKWSIMHMFCCAFFVRNLLS